jgi:uncharacterized protein YneF (UPF0154 family)
MNIFLTICWIALFYFIINGVLAIIIALRLLDEIKDNPQNFEEEIRAASQYPLTFVLTIMGQQFYNIVDNIIILVDFEGHMEQITKIKNNGYNPED